MKIIVLELRNFSDDDRWIHLKDILSITKDNHYNEDHSSIFIKTKELTYKIMTGVLLDNFYESIYEFIDSDKNVFKVRIEQMYNAEVKVVHCRLTDWVSTAMGK